MIAAHIMIARLTDPAAALTPAWLAQLGDDDRRRAESFRAIADRARLVVGRSLRRHGLRTLYGLESPAWIKGLYGKPLLADRRYGIDVSLAHGGEFVACGFIRDAAIGVDVEPIDRSWNAMEVANAQFAPAECAALSRPDDETRCETFFRLWTLKEAVAKATGLGLTMPLNSFAVSLDPPRLCSESELGDPAQWRLAECRIGDTRIAAAVHGDDVGDFTLTEIAPATL